MRIVADQFCTKMLSKHCLFKVFEVIFNFRPSRMLPLGHWLLHTSRTEIRSPEPRKGPKALGGLACRLSCRKPASQAGLNHLPGAASVAVVCAVAMTMQVDKPSRFVNPPRAYCKSSATCHIKSGKKPWLLSCSPVVGSTSSERGRHRDGRRHQQYHSWADET